MDRRRKLRTTIGLGAKDSLERHFIRHLKLSSYDIARVAISLNKEVVRVWFCNRRQRDKRVKTSLHNESISMNESESRCIHDGDDNEIGHNFSF